MATAILLIVMATAILVIATATATANPLMATDILPVTTAGIIRAIATPVTPTVGPTMDMPVIPIVDRPSSLSDDVKDRLRAVFPFESESQLMLAVRGRKARGCIPGSPARNADSEPTTLAIN